VSGSKEKLCRTCSQEVAAENPFDQCLGCRWDGLTKVDGQRLLNMGWRWELAFSCFYCSSAAESFEHAWRVWDGRQETYRYKFVCDDCAASHCWKCGQQEDALSAFSLCPLCAGNFLEELHARPQWVTWKYEPSKGGGKPKKPPYNPVTLEKGSHSNPDDWATFEEALDAYANDRLQNSVGVGFVFTKDDPYAGVDLDNCRDPETGDLEPWAEAVVAFLNSYTEVSPSATGVKVFLKGRLPADRHKKGVKVGQTNEKAIEMYDWKRYFTVTGQHLDSTPMSVQERHDELSLLQSFFLPPPERQASAPKPNPNKEIPDDELLAKAFSSRYGVEIRRLWEGDWAGRPSQSEADQALCKHLAFWTGGDEERMDVLFRQSELYRDKWDEIHSGDDRTYGEMTIAKGIQYTRHFYEDKYRGDNWRNRRTAPKPKPGDGFIRVYSELAADSLKRKDVSHFLLWCSAIAVDKHGSGKALRTDVVNFLTGVYSRSYIYRFMRNFDAMETFFWWPDNNTGDDSFAWREPIDPKWRCLICRERICNCNPNEGFYLHYKSPARVASSYGLGVAMDIPLKQLEGEKDKRATMFSAYLAGLPYLPASQDALKGRTGVAESTQRDWRRKDYFSVIHQSVEKEVPKGKVPSQAVLKGRGAFVKDGKLKYQIASVHLSKLLLYTAPPSPWLRKRASSFAGAGEFASNAPVHRDGGADVKRLEGWVYFLSEKKRREHSENAAPLTYVQQRGGFWEPVEDVVLVDGKLVPVFVEEQS
jgi:hypothetical protein